MTDPHSDAASIAILVVGAIVLALIFFAAATHRWQPEPTISAEPLPGPPAAVPASLPSPTRPRNVVRPDGPGTR